MTKAQPKPKLPKVWVEFKEGVAWGTYYHRPATQYRGKSEFHQYAPVQKPRVCVWRGVPGSNLSDTIAMGDARAILAARKKGESK